jgi:CheY-like chemotaxis protein/HPt (histidine-containing phosphotransfer) domain-containing protein
VLVAVANASARDVLVATLAHAGYDASGAASATGALDLLFAAQASHRPYECLLLDRILPDMDGETLAERLRQDSSLDKHARIMLSAVDHSPDVTRLDSLGFAGSLSKPVRTPELLALLDRALSGDGSPWHLGTQPVAAVSASAAADSAARVLLVEDNLVNQKVAARFLERLGCTVQIASNGEEGVRAYRDGEFDIVFMDQQMPVMDGMTATRQIRALEAAGRARTPIVALTANAMMGQLDRCLAADMDAFLTKPLQSAQLQEVLDRFATSAMSSRNSNANTPAVEIAPVDVVRFRELVGDDVEFGHELIATFRSSSELAADEIARTLAASDRAALARAAHKLKGAGANVGAMAVGSLATALESEASTANETRLRELGNAIHVEVPRTIEFLLQLLDVTDRAIVG